MWRTHYLSQQFFCVNIWFVCVIVLLWASLCPSAVWHGCTQILIDWLIDIAISREYCSVGYPDFTYLLSWCLSIRCQAENGPDGIVDIMCFDNVDLHAGTQPCAVPPLNLAIIDLCQLQFFPTCVHHSLSINLPAVISNFDFSLVPPSSLLLLSAMHPVSFNSCIIQLLL